jgi:thiamine-monophosphate kinase
MAGGKLHRGSRFNALTLRPGFVREATSKLSSGMDISDGLFSDLQKLSDVNRLGFRFDRRIGKRIGCSGEEYEMLVGFDPRCRRAIERIARKHRTPLTVIGRARRGRFVNRCKAHHF